MIRGWVEAARLWLDDVEPIRKQPATTYERPIPPGFHGGYLFRNSLIGLCGLLLVNIFATQSVAGLFSYQRGLGAPWFRASDRLFALYPPWSWAIWTLRYTDAPSRNTRLGVLMGNGIVVVGTAFTIGVIYAINTRRLRKLTEGTQDLHGSARWANDEDIAASGLAARSSGVYVGAIYRGHRHNQSLQYLRHDGPEHVLAFAPTRSGKGVGLVIPTLLGWAESVVIYDIKGENWAKTAGYRSKTMDQVVLQFAPTDESGNCTRFNPLAEVRIYTLRDVSDAQNIAEILVNNIEDRPSDTHWIDTAASILTASILHLCYVAHAESKEANLAQLASFFTRPGKSFMETLNEMQSTAHDTREESTTGFEAWTDYLGRPTKTHPTVKELAQTAIL
jgi:type IV secretion system protein VirD4